MKLSINISLSFGLSFDAEKVFEGGFPKKKSPKLRTGSISEKGVQYFFVQWYPQHTLAKPGIITCGGVDFHRGESMQGVKHIVITLLLAVLPFGVGVYPRSFTHLKTEIVSENDQFVALKMYWIIDEIISTDLLYDAGNTKPGDEIWKKLAAEVMANVLGQCYFTEVWHDGKRVESKNRLTEYGVAQEEYQAMLAFILPLAEAQLLNSQKYAISTFDPTYYANMSYDKDSGIRLGQAISQRCRISVHTPTPNEQTLSFVQSLDKEDTPPEDMELGKQFVQTVTL